MAMPRFLAMPLVAAMVAAMPLGAAAQKIMQDANSTLFINGGIGEEEADAMRSRAAEFSLRVVLADGPRNEFTAKIPVAISDARGNTVFTLPDAGPLLYVMLPEGRYTVSAESDGIRKSQQVTVGRGRGTDVVFHWNTPSNAY